MRSRVWLLGLSIGLHSPSRFVRSLQPQSNMNPQTSLNAGPTCQVYPVTIQTWEELRIDDYIRNFPGGKLMSLEDFTFVNKVSNFVCGLGENCLAGQQCSPFQGQLWFILYALQEWNLYVNSLYEAVTAAITQVRDMATDMITDFLIDQDEGHEQTVALAVALTAVAATTVLGFAIGYAGTLLLPTMGATVEVAETSSVAAAATGGATAAVVKRSLVKRETSSNIESDFEPSPVTLEEIEKSDAKLTNQIMRLNQLEIEASSQLFHHQGTEAEMIINQPLQGEGSKTLALRREIRDDILRSSAWSGWFDHLAGDLHHTPMKLKKRDLNPELAAHEHLERRSRLKRRSAPQSIPKDHFSTWTTINKYFTSFRDHLRAVIAVTSQIGLSSPISSDEGIWGILKGGKFMTLNPAKGHLQDRTRETVKLSALAQVLKSMNVFVTIGSDKCDSGGPGGAWLGDQYLSYCSPEGLMMNLVRGQGKKTVNKIINAHLIQTKYGYTVEFLAQSAWACQDRNLKIDGRPSPIGLKPGSTVGCTFDLAVCDTRAPEVAHLREKGETTVVACRKGLALNI